MPGEDEILAGFGTSRDRLLGGGGETEVFALDEERVLRLYRRATRPRSQTVSQLRALYAAGPGSTSASRCR